MQESSLRRPKKKNLWAPEPHYKRDLSMNALARAKKFSFKFEKKKFELGHQNGSPHIKSCFTHKKGNKIMHEEVIQNQTCEGTQEKFS